MTDPVKVFAVVMLAIALTAMLGYVLDWPMLYAQWNGVGMSFNSALGFLLCGLSFLYLRREKDHGDQK